MSDKQLPADPASPVVPAVPRTYNMEQSGDGTNIGVAQSVSLIASGEAGIQTGTIDAYVYARLYPSPESPASYAGASCGSIF